MVTSNNSNSDTIKSRTRFFVISFIVIFLLIIGRLFYWQIVESAALESAAEQQYQQNITNQGKRGTIYTSDGSILVTNETVYRLFAEPQHIKEPEETAEELARILTLDDPTIFSTVKQDLATKLGQKDKKWLSLKENISEQTKEKIAELEIFGLGFDPYLKRSYPEASMAAHLTGFVGKNENGQDIGYFGLEGALEKELKAQSMSSIVATDAFGQELLSDVSISPNALNGRNIITTIRRDTQYLAESALQEGIEKYGAKAGEIIIMDPKTGAILASAGYPTYSQNSFHAYAAETYKNPTLTHLYEPGSTFKVLTVAAGIDAGVISPDTQCPICSGPRTFGKYTIRTWNDQYYPDTTMTEGLMHSDNTAMIYIAEQLGSERFSEYLKKFGIGEKIHLDLQEDTNTPFPNKWGPVELATTSFGQGISTSGLQLTRAISAIANGGVMMRPRIVAAVQDTETNEKHITEAIVERTVVSPETAKLTTQMMIKAAEAGEAQWIRSKTHTIAGKTGTSQIAVNGSYDPDKTIASFIGFAPAHDPQFVMLVKLVEPTTSIWAAETAAPLWYQVANKLFVMMQIPPDQE